MVRRNITADYMRTVFHEMVGHYGLRKLLGNYKYDQLCALVYDGMTSSEKLKWREYAERELNNNEAYQSLSNKDKEMAIRQTAADEYMAKLAEEGCRKPQQLTTWQKIKRFIREFFNRIGLAKLNITDYDIALLLYESKMNIGDRAITAEEWAEIDWIMINVADRMEKNETIDTRFGVRKKKSSTTVATLQDRSGRASVVAEDSNAKVQQSLDSAKEKYKNINKTRGFISDITEALKLTNKGRSRYRSFVSDNGIPFALRISNHNATISHFDEHGEDNGISIVISRFRDNGIKNDGKAHVVEYFYSKKKIENANGEPLVSIIESMKEMLRTGEYVDRTGIATREEVNKDIRYSIDGDGEIEDMDLNQAYELSEEEAAQQIEEWSREDTERLVEDNGFDKNNPLVKSTINSTVSTMKAGLGKAGDLFRNQLEEWFDSRLMLRLLRNAINKVNGNVMRPAKDFFVLANNIASQSRGMTGKFRDEVGLKFTSTFAGIVDNKIAKIFKQNGRERATVP